MRAALVAAVLALAVVSAQARISSIGASVLFTDEVDAQPLAVTSQRALKQGTVPTPSYSPSPPVCANANLPTQIVARVAILQRAPVNSSTDSVYGIRLYTRALAPVFRAQNLAFSTKLKYSVKLDRADPGVFPNPAPKGKSNQAWFYYRIVLDIGRCGAYKSSFIGTVRSYIRKPRPGGTHVRKIRVINY